LMAMEGGLLEELVLRGWMRARTGVDEGSFITGACIFVAHVRWLRWCTVDGGVSVEVQVSSSGRTVENLLDDWQIRWWVI
jgi:hypothetical protein